ncbi:hypothetical protein P3451_22880, partial [Vibrio parahaemolyticus]|nr:hypothetical protein [Vibrio parahaemolyticus]
IPASNMDVAAKMVKTQILWMLHTHLQPGSAKDLYNHHSFKVNTVSAIRSVPDLWFYIMARKVFLQTILMSQ